MRPHVSIIIPVRNGEETLGECLRSIRVQLQDGDEIIVVDDGSRDRSAAIAESLQATVLRLPETKGQCAARNQGLEAARGEIVVFTDADCIVHPRWMEKLLRPILTEGFDGAVGRIASVQNHWVARLVQAEFDERYVRMAERETIDFLNTGNCAFRKELLGEKAFDEELSWLEDVELSFRLAEAGYRMKFVPDACIDHQRSCPTVEPPRLAGSSLCC